MTCAILIVCLIICFQLAQMDERLTTPAQRAAARRARKARRQRWDQWRTKNGWKVFATFFGSSRGYVVGSALGPILTPLNVEISVSRYG